MSLNNVDSGKKSPREIAQEIAQKIKKELKILETDITKNGELPNGVPLTERTQIEKGEEPKENANKNDDMEPETRKEIDINPEILKEEMRKDLPDTSMMSHEQIKAELESYGVEIPDEGKDKDNLSDLRILLNRARNTIANNDKNSNIIDFHIGTYTQGRSKFCSILAQLDTMTDEEIKNMIKIENSDNKIIYHVTFPQDRSRADITEEELTQGTLTINGQEITIDHLPKGDKDVRLITMAYIMNFGTHIIDNGEWQYIAQNRFRDQTDQLKDNQYFEDIQDYTNLPPHSTIAVLNPDELKRKGFDFKIQSKDAVSWVKDKQIKREATQEQPGPLTNPGAFITELPSGKKVCITATYMYISDGTLIPAGHAMTIRGYDEESEELLVSGSEYNNVSVVRIPKEVFEFLETASPEGAPGVDKTPEPSE